MIKLTSDPNARQVGKFAVGVGMTQGNLDISMETKRHVTPIQPVHSGSVKEINITTNPVFLTVAKKRNDGMYEIYREYKQLYKGDTWIANDKWMCDGSIIKTVDQNTFDNI